LNTSTPWQSSCHTLLPKATMHSNHQLRHTAPLQMLLQICHLCCLLCSSSRARTFTEVHNSNPCPTTYNSSFSSSSTCYHQILPPTYSFLPTQYSSSRHRLSTVMVMHSSGTFSITHSNHVYCLSVIMITCSCNRALSMMHSRI
jgi:hypothetical protein